MKKTLILFYSKNNTTKETVDKIKRKATNKVDIIEIGKNENVDFSKYNRIFVGTGIYMGGIPSKVTKLLSKYKQELVNKEIFFFIHGIISQDNHEEIIGKAMNKIMYTKQIKSFYLGGKLDINSQNFLIKKLLIQVAKQNNFDPYKANTIDDAKIEDLILQI